MGHERRDDAADRRRADVYSSARIGAAAALTIVLVVLLVLDVEVPDYDISRGILQPLLGAILALHRQRQGDRDGGAHQREQDRLRWAWCTGTTKRDVYAGLRSILPT
jgi:hypothetical protein